MLLVKTIGELRAIRAKWRAAGERLTLVPTMGNLHAGHLSLVEQARQHGERVAVSIFVNPLQFSPGEDFDQYPRTLDDDLRALSELDPDVVFAPSVTELYPRGAPIQTSVVVGELAHRFCGEDRPGHFVGASTVVALLFNLFRPDAAIFGEKDYQQLLIFQRMAADLHMGVEVLGGTTVREPNGLAMSSRNRYLSEAQHAQAAELLATLRWVRDQVQAGARGPCALTDVEEAAWIRLEKAGFKPQYVRILDTELNDPDEQTEAFHVIAAARLGAARLIDNLPIPAG